VSVRFAVALNFRTQWKWGARCQQGPLRQEGTCSSWGLKQAGLEGVYAQKHAWAGCSVLARFAWVYCGREPGAEAWLEGVRPQNARAGHALIRLGSEYCVMQAPKGVMCLGYGLGERNGAHQFLCSWRNLPRIPAPSSIRSDISKQISLPYTAGVFQTAASMLYLNRAFGFAVSLRVGIQFPLCLPYWLLQDPADF